MENQLFEKFPRTVLYFKALLFDFVGSLIWMKVIVHLIRNLDSIRVPAARGMIIWMVGEYSDIGHLIPKVLPVVLKYLARCFTVEDVDTKLQILNACTKVFHEKSFILFICSSYLLCIEVGEEIMPVFWSAT